MADMVRVDFIKKNLLSPKPPGAPSPTENLLILFPKFLPPSSSHSSFAFFDT